MVKAGDKIYHWRYGGLKVVGLEEISDRTYIEAIVEDMDGVIDDIEKPWIMSYIKQANKTFNMHMFGKILHKEKESAVIDNRNTDMNFPKHLEPDCYQQGQVPCAMQFPIKKSLFHKSYHSFIEEMSESEEKKARLLEEKNRIENDLEELLINTDVLFNKIKEDIISIADIISKEITIKKFIKTEKIKGVDLKLLKELAANSSNENFDWNNDYQNLRDSYKENQQELKTPEEYKKFADRTETYISELNKIYKENHLLAKKEIEKLLASADIGSINIFLKSCIKDPSLLKESKISQEIIMAKEEYLKNKSKEMKDKIKEIDRSLPYLEELVKKWEKFNHNLYTE